jgi:hypothetical protein
MNPFPTSKENIVIDLVFEWLGESRINRTQAEYDAIIARVPKDEAVHAYVSEKLRLMASDGAARYEICYFKRGDRRKPWYEAFPTSLSRETVRTALIKSGLRPKRTRAKG